MNAEKLAAEIADMELSYKIQLGEFNYWDIWDMEMEECHGPKSIPVLSTYGRKEYNKIFDKWLEKCK